MIGKAVKMFVNFVLFVIAMVLAFISGMGTMYLIFMKVFKENDEERSQDPREFIRYTGHRKPAYPPYFPVRERLRNISFGSRDQAENALKVMTDNVKDIGCVTVGDLMDVCGLNSTFEDQKYGWTDLKGMSVYEKDHDGRYFISFPILPHLLLY